ncbi:MAG: cell division protein FtsZ, partial [Hydrogenobacter sp.]
EETISKIRDLAHEDALIIFGAVLEDTKENFMRVAVVATDFEDAQTHTHLKVVKKPEPKDIKKVVPETIIEPVQPELEDIPAYLRRKRKL